MDRYKNIHVCKSGKVIIDTITNIIPFKSTDGLCTFKSKQVRIVVNGKSVTKTRGYFPETAKIAFKKYILSQFV